MLCSLVLLQLNQVLADITFNISPSNSGHIKCNKQEFPTNQYIRIGFGTQCTAEANKGFQFGSWIENLGHNSSKTITASTLSYDSPFNSVLNTLGLTPKDNASYFNITQYGNFTANFEKVPPPIPPEYWAPLYAIIITSIVGWSIPSIIGWIKAKRKRKESLHEYDDIVKSLSDTSNSQNLETINNRVTRAYLSEKINESQYKIIQEKVTEYYKNRTDRKNSKIVHSYDSTNQQEDKRSPI